MRSKGFTLIELLIVVAIIAILAAIAIPNFIEAQIRSKVSRVKADMRSIGTAIESYRVDNTHYPNDRQELAYTLAVMDPVDNMNYLEMQALTTPISYMSSIPQDTFVNRWADRSLVKSYYFNYWAEGWRDTILGIRPTGLTPNAAFQAGGVGVITGAIWSLTSHGPDLDPDFGSYLIFGEKMLNSVGSWTDSRGDTAGPGALYDATNGTKSSGDIVRIGP